MYFAYFGLAFLVAIIWGFSFIAIKLGLHGIPPLFLLTLRLLLTSIPAVFFIKKPPIPFKQVALYGFVMFILQFGMIFAGMHLGISPGLSALIVQIQIFFSLILGNLFFQEKPLFWQIIGCFIAFFGLGIVALHMQGVISFQGFFCLVLGGFFWSLGNLISKKLPRINTFSLITWASLFSWPPVLILSLCIEGPTEIFATLKNINITSVAAVLYISYFSILIGYGLWSYLTYHVPLFTLSLFTILVPTTAIISSVLYLDEPLEQWKIIAAGCILLGLLLNVFSKKLTHYGNIILQKWRVEGE